MGILREIRIEQNHCAMAIKAAIWKDFASNYPMSSVEEQKNRAKSCTFQPIF